MNAFRMMLVCASMLLAGVPAWANGAAKAESASQASSSDLRRLVKEISLEHGLDPKLVDSLVRVESAYNPKAVSHRGAMGLMQLMPQTAKRLRVANPFDPESNIRGGVREFARLIERYSGNLQLALAAYNAGENAVARYRGIPPYSETRNYVSKIMTLYTGRPYRVPGIRRSIPVRMTQDDRGVLVITNVSASSRPPSLGSGPLRGGFGNRE
ncbi:MAG: lytic transglycosylase domain-containing protein [Holophagae bacterium]